MWPPYRHEWQSEHSKQSACRLVTLASESHRAVDCWSDVTHWNSSNITSLCYQFRGVVLSRQFLWCIHWFDLESMAMLWCNILIQVVCCKIARLQGVHSQDCQAMCCIHVQHAETTLHHREFLLMYTHTRTQQKAKYVWVAFECSQLTAGPTAAPVFG